MNKTELINEIALQSGESKAAVERVLGAFTGEVTRTVKKGGSVQIVGFGTFASSKRAARTGKNPKTGEALQIPARRAPTFKAGKAFKDALN